MHEVFRTMEGFLFCAKLCYADLTVSHLNCREKKQIHNSLSLSNPHLHLDLHTLHHTRLQHIKILQARLIKVRILSR